MKRILPLVLSIALFFALSLVWIAGDRRAPGRIYDEYSSASTAEEGLSLAAGYLARSRKVAMLTRPLGRERLEADSVVFRVTSHTPLFFDPEDLDDTKFGPPKPRTNPLLNDAEEAFVRRGGRMIIASPGALPAAREVEGEPKKVFPLWPRVEAFDDGMEGWPELPPRMHAIFASGALTVLARQRIGAGELFVLSAPHVLSNADIANHLELLHALAGDRRPVYFDEVVHGIVSDDGVLALLKEWRLGPLLLLLAAIAALVFWREGRRIGPPEEEHRETRSEAIDLVRSLGALYDEVTTNAAAIALYYETLIRTVATRTGLRGDALRARVDALTRGFVPPARYEEMSAATFRQQLDILNEAFAGVHSHAKHR